MKHIILNQAMLFTFLPYQNNMLDVSIPIRLLSIKGPAMTNVEHFKRQK